MVAALGEHLTWDKEACERRGAYCRHCISEFEDLRRPAPRVEK